MGITEIWQMLHDAFYINLVTDNKRWENPLGTNTLFCKAIFPPMYLVDDTKFLNKNDVNKQISCVKHFLYASSDKKKRRGRRFRKVL